MAERALGFPAEEYHGRVARLRQEMDQHGLDALLLTMPADIFYVTGFLTRFWESPARPWFVLVPRASAPVAIIPSIGAALMEQCWITEIRTWEAPHPGDDGISLLATTICDLLSEHACIGVPMGLETHLRMPLADYRQAERLIAPRRMVDGTQVVQRVREIKSEAEIRKIRTACETAGRAFDRLPGIARPGQPLDQVFRDFQIALLSEGADWVSYLAGGAGPDGYGDVISPATSAPLAVGDILMLDTGSVQDGYFCDFDRNIAIGQPSETACRAHDALWQTTETVLAALRPGMRACDAHRLIVEALTREGGVPCAGRLGHGVGVSLTEWPSFTALDQTELREGMVLSIEPATVTGPGRIMVHEENVVLRSHGPECLSPRAPASLRRSDP